MNSHPLFSAICCPVGGVAQNGICYCTDREAEQHPFACRVICEQLIAGRSPANGGCQCKTGHAGATCDLEPCYIYGKDLNLKLYCRTAHDSYFDCTNETNLVSRDNFTDVYSPCQCLNHGERFLRDEIDGTTFGCICPESFDGDICQAPIIIRDDPQGHEDQVTANTFLAIIAISLLIVALTFYCIRRYRKRKRRVIEEASDYHRHYRPPPDSPAIADTLLAYGQSDLPMALVEGKVTNAKV